MVKVKGIVIFFTCNFINELLEYILNLISILKFPGHVMRKDALENLTYKVYSEEKIRVETSSNLFNIFVRMDGRTRTELGAKKSIFTVQQKKIGNPEETLIFMKLSLTKLQV